MARNATIGVTWERRSRLAQCRVPVSTATDSDHFAAEAAACPDGGRESNGRACRSIVRGGETFAPGHVWRGEVVGWGAYTRRKLGQTAAPMFLEAHQSNAAARHTCAKFALTLSLHADCLTTSHSAQVILTM